MLCLSDIQLFLLLLWKMAPRWVRQGYGSVPLAAGKKVLVLDLCSCVAHHVLTGLCGNSVSFWLTSVCSVSLLCHCQWFGLSAWPSHSEVLRPVGSSALVSITDPSEVLLCLLPKPWTGLTQLLTITDPLAGPPAFDSAVSRTCCPTQGHMETSRSYPSHTKPSGHSEKPNSFANHAVPSNSTPRWPPKKLGQCNLWDELLPESQTQNRQRPPPKILHNLTNPPSHSELMPPWRVLGTFSFSCSSPISSFQSPRPEEGMFLFLPIPICPGLLLSNLSQKRWAPSSSLLFLLLLLDSALWLSLNSQWGEQERERLKNNLT